MSYKLRLTLIVSFLFWGFTFKRSIAQDMHKVDSLKTLLESTKEDTLRVILLNKIALEIKSYSPDTALQFVQNALRLAIKIDFKTGLAGSYYCFGNIYNYQDKFDKALENYFISLKIYNEICDKKNKKTIQNALSAESKCKQSLANTYYNIGQVYWNQNKYELALENYFTSLKLREKLGDKYKIAESNLSIGAVYTSNDNYDKALEYYFASLKTYEEIGDKKWEAATHNNIGEVYRLCGKYDKALENYFISLKMKEEIFEQTRIKKIDVNPEYIQNCKKEIAGSYNNIGIIYDEQGNYKKALENFLASLKIREEIDDKKDIADSYGNIAINYCNQGFYETALEYFFKSLKVNEYLGDKYNMAGLYNNIGELFIFLGSDTVYSPSLTVNVDKLLDQYKLNDLSAYGTTIPPGRNGMNHKALKFLLKAVRFAEEIGSKDLLTHALPSIGDLYVKTNMATEAISFYVNAIEISKEYGIKPSLSYSYNGISTAWSKMASQTENPSKKNEYLNNALKYFKMHIALKDSIFNEQNTKAIAEMQTKYETEKKEKEIEMLTKDNELQIMKAEQQNDQIKKQWLLIIAIVFVLGLAFSLMYVIYSQFKFKKAANEELELKNRTVEEINKELDKKNRSVAESINYAQRIQETIMPTQNHLKKFFPESFIFYKAKDVISGDFPWVWSSNGSKDGIYVSAVDCTGHGVPGAMMSMIGYFLLNEIVNDRKIHQPSEILNHLHESIKQTLRQEENMESNDGMDLALCNISKTHMEVQFSGAHRPMLWLHKGEIIEVKGNRFPIGGMQYSRKGKEIKFTNHVLKLEKGDSIYFYSDGLVDQLSSESGKRFKNNLVKKIILENQNKSMQEIHDIMNEEFTKWMGSSKQLDDVLMVGIRM